MPSIRNLAALAAAALAAAALVASCTPAGDEATEPTRDEAADATPAAPGAEVASGDELTCSYPVAADDTEASLRQRFGADARAETIYGPEGIELPGVALWSDDQQRRVEVVFSEEGERPLAFVGVSGASAWRLAGLALGDPLARAEEANGRPFELWGFGWDYGGYVSDLRGGSLAALPGGCRAIVRFNLPEDAEVGEGLLGEVRLSSDDPALASTGARIVELSLTFERE